MAICPQVQTDKTELHKVFADVLDNIPDFLVFKLHRSHSGSLGAIFDDPVHLTRRNLFHRLFTGEVTWRRLQGFAQFAIATAFGTMTHLTCHWLGFFLIKFLTIGFVGFLGIIFFGNTTWSRLCFSWTRNDKTSRNFL